MKPVQPCDNMDLYAGDDQVDSDKASMLMTEGQSALGKPAL